MKVFYLFLLCVSSAVGEPPQVVTNPVELNALKEGDTLTLTCSGADGNTISFHKNDATADAITGDSISDGESGAKILTFTSLKKTDEDTYYCVETITTGEGGTENTEKEIALAVLKPEITMTTPDSGTPVATEQVVLTCASQSPTDAAYSWTKDTTDLTEGLDATKKIYTISSYVAADHDGDYICKVTNGDAFLNSEKFTLGSSAAALTLTAVLLPVCLLLQTLVN